MLRLLAKCQLNQAYDGPERERLGWQPRKNDELSQIGRGEQARLSDSLLRSRDGELHYARGTAKRSKAVSPTPLDLPVRDVPEFVGLCWIPSDREHE